MDPINHVLALKVLDGLSARAEATAQNIANASTPGYRPVSVTFEGALAAAADTGAPALERVRPTLQRTEAAGADLRLDLELETAAATQLRYSAVVEVLSRSLALRQAALSGGR
jgi:flagellar basal-body rod protein FlgB